MSNQNHPWEKEILGIGLDCKVMYNLSQDLPTQRTLNWSEEFIKHLTYTAQHIFSTDIYK